MNHVKRYCRKYRLRRAEWIQAESPAGSQTVILRNIYSGQEVIAIEEGRQVSHVEQTVLPSTPGPRFNDHFGDVDQVGQSEYATIVEHLADVANIPNIAGVAGDNATIDEDTRDLLVGSLTELIRFARRAHNRLRKFKYPDQSG